jgi:hypothetical protein
MHNSINVFEIDPDVVDPVSSRKAILAMQATKQFVDGDERYEQTNERLVGLARKIGKSATMTYEDLIFNDTFFDGKGIRVNSDDPETAAGEADFYYTHRMIEDNLYDAIGALSFMDKNKGYYKAGRSGNGMFIGRLRIDKYVALESIKTATRDLGRLRQRLDPETFSKFRPYFIGLNGYPGPSGLYSASLPILDLLVHGGSNITSEERDQIHSNIEQGLYPGYNDQDAQLKKLLGDEDPQLKMPDAIRDSITEQLDSFRHAHKASVQKFVPGALDGTAEGSGGVKKVAEYLNSKIIVQKGKHHD